MCGKEIRTVFCIWSVGELGKSIDNSYGFLAPAAACIIAEQPLVTKKGDVGKYYACPLSLLLDHSSWQTV